MHSFKFSIKRPYEFKDRVHLQISFEFDLTLYRVDRDVYSILDWVGDVGGLNEGLFLFFQVILVFSQFYDFEHFLIERLFLLRRDRSKETKAKGSDKLGTTSFDDNKTRWSVQRLNKLCCQVWKCLPCCRLRREERLFAKARDSLMEETDIVQFLKKIRRLEAFRTQVTEKLELKPNSSDLQQQVLIESSGTDDTKGQLTLDKPEHPRHRTRLRGQGNFQTVDLIPGKVQ